MEGKWFDRVNRSIKNGVLDVLIIVNHACQPCLVHNSVLVCYEMRLYLAGLAAAVGFPKDVFPVSDFN